MELLPQKRILPVWRKLFDFLLNLVMAAVMTCIVCGGFHVAPEMQFNLGFLIIVPALYLLLLFAFGHSRLTAVAGVPALITLTVLGVFFAGSMSGQAALMADVEGNPCVFIVIAASVTVIVHLLCRTYTGSIVLFVVGAIVAALIQFLYHFDFVVLTIVFLAFSVATIVYKYYQRAFMLADAKDIPRYGSAFLAALVTSVVVVGMGAGLFFGIDALFHPQALELKPFKEYFAYEVVDITGVADDTEVDNEDLTTPETNDESKIEGGELGEEQQSSPPENDQQSRGTPTEGSMLTYTQEALQDTFEVISYGFDWWQPYVLALIVAILVIAPIVVKKLLRRRWHARVLARPANEQIVDFYLFFLNRFERIGLGKPESATALSFAANTDESMRVFEQNAGGVTLAELSREYTRCAYGSCEPSAGAIERFESFYRGFYKSCRKHVGSFKYLFKFFRL